MVKIVMAAVAYDRSIDERFGDVVEVAVAGDSSRATELMAVLGKYSGKKLKGKDIQLTNVSVADIGTAKLDIVFFADSLGADAGTVAALCQQNQITAISADEDGVASGLALGVELTSDGKPKLLINLDAAKSAGANFSAQILKLARLVDGK